MTTSQSHPSSLQGECKLSSSELKAAYTLPRELMDQHGLNLAQQIGKDRLAGSHHPAGQLTDHLPRESKYLYRSALHTTQYDPSRVLNQPLPPKEYQLQLISQDISNQSQVL